MEDFFLREKYIKKRSPAKLSAVLINQMSTHFLINNLCASFFSSGSAALICLAEQRRKITSREIRVRSVSL